MCPAPKICMKVLEDVSYGFQKNVKLGHIQVSAVFILSELVTVVELQILDAGLVEVLLARPF